MGHQSGRINVSNREELSRPALSGQVETLKTYFKMQQGVSSCLSRLLGLSVIQEKVIAHL